MPGKIIRVALIGLLLSAPACAGAIDHLTVRAALAYDFISQEYFVDSIANEGDELAFALKTNYLDDLKGRLGLVITPFSDSRFTLSPTYEQTADFFRLRLKTDYSGKFDQGKLYINSEIDWKEQYADSAESGLPYRYGYFRAKYQLPVDLHWSSHFQFMAEGVDFDTVASGSRDYYRLGGKIGLGFQSDDFSFGQFSLFAGNRKVPDSTEMDYFSYGIEGDYFAPLGSGDISLMTRLEEKNYNQPADEDDQIRFELTGYGRIGLGGNLVSRQEIQIDVVAYSAADAINRNYQRYQLALLGGYESGFWSFGLGPAFELFKEQQFEDIETEDYFESAGKITLDLISPGRLFGSIESETGFRDLKYENEFQSNFTFERINLIGDAKIWNGISASLLFSAEWEWHKSDFENTKIYLVSSSLTYSF